MVEGKFLQSLYSSKFFIDIIAQNATKLVGEKENNYRVKHQYQAFHLLSHSSGPLAARTVGTKSMEGI